MQNIEIIRGTTQIINVSVMQDDGKAYEFQNGDILKLAIKRDIQTDDNYELYTEAVLGENGQAVFNIAPEDTARIRPGTNYHFDVGLQTAAGDFYIIIPYGKCVIKPAITQKEVTS